MSQIVVRQATVADAPGILSASRAAFGARPILGAAPAALQDSVADLETRLERGTALVAAEGSKLVGGLFFEDSGSDSAYMSRVHVHPGFQGQGIARALIETAIQAAAIEGFRTLELDVSSEYPEHLDSWRRYGFMQIRRNEQLIRLRRDLPVVVEVPTAADMQNLGRKLAKLLRPGDLLVLDGELGAGKTTLTQGIGAGMRVDGAIISPTFVLSRIHPPLEAGPALVHVDAYRLASAAEVFDIDIADTLAESITVIEWGRGLAEQLSDSRLEVTIDRADDTRVVYLGAVGPAWNDRDLTVLESE
ncbi:MAG: tRNA (adenosine(37)-N6)-threonylcarbamoyltransferase complex ATPase subunit type 1 TsaE [Propionibacterium sp.]|nr:MAG: tRNA (adenosine(37)-N6)-threonylcarbamoyltransferase complex ATPase subunit type 1 TsaE [Propionibacterium sp.]